MSASPRTTDRRRVPRILLTRQEAADSLGMSLRHFQRYVQPHVTCYYSGKQLRLYRPADLEEFVASQLDRKPGSA